MSGWVGGWVGVRGMNEVEHGRAEQIGPNGDAALHVLNSEARPQKLN